MGLWSASLGLGASSVCILYALRKWRESQWDMGPIPDRLDGQVVIITGATSGLGKVLAQDLANRGATIVLACRNIVAANQVIADIKDKNPNVNLDVVELNLASLNSVRKCAEKILEKYSQINVLINNAGVSIPTKLNMKTEDGFEVNFGINHLGHFLLTSLLADRMKASAPSRVIVVSSRLHEQGFLDWEAFEGKKCFDEGKRGPNSAYCSSKLANVLFSIKLADKLKEKGVNVYCVCPGWNYTQLFRYSSVPIYSWIAIVPIAFWFMKPAKIGVQTIVHCAVSEKIKEETGLFYRDCKVYQSQAKISSDAASKLWEFSCKLCNVEW